MDSTEPAETDTPATPAGGTPPPGGPPTRPRAKVRRRTLLLAALGLTAGTVTFAEIESRASDDDPRERVFTVPDGHARSVAFSPDGRTLVAGLSGVRGTGSTLRSWNVAKGISTTPWPDEVEEVTKVAFSPDGRTLAVAGTLQVALWNAAKPTGVALPLSALDLAFSPDGRTLATGGRDGAARLWDLATGTVTDTLTAKGMTVVNTVAFRSDGYALATGSEDLTDSQVRLWDLQALFSPTVDATLEAPHWQGFKPVAFQPVTYLMATGGDDGIVRVWDSVSGTLQFTRTGHTGPVTAVAFSPDGDTLATGSEDRTVRLWDTSTLDVVPVDILTGHTDEVTSVAFSPHGRTVASASLDSTVRLWPIP
ncbi:WD40 repeat domain-containing protein [Streptomyces sp. NBC_01478]|uniref:WD40 repeat domain-containing protein n=1 Tax=Streptomyces sp. NBC_01478 TaxID=2903882 RepID=UPI002E3337B2|nr:WD40 repeat domain-containing protein [Streptomyces sp. NBC_01478]